MEKLTRNQEFPKSHYCPYSFDLGDISHLFLFGTLTISIRNGVVFDFFFNFFVHFHIMNRTDIILLTVALVGLGSLAFLFYYFINSQTGPVSTLFRNNL